MSLSGFVLMCSVFLVVGLQRKVKLLNPNWILFAIATLGYVVLIPYAFGVSFSTALGGGAPSQIEMFYGVYLPLLASFLMAATIVGKGIIEGTNRQTVVWASITFIPALLVFGLGILLGP